MRILYMQKCNENIEKYQSYLSNCKTHFKLLLKCILMDTDTQWLEFCSTADSASLRDLRIPT